MPEEKENKEPEDPRQGLPENVNVEIADFPFEPQEPIEGDEEKGFVKYVGVATVRQMTPGDWKQVGAADFNQFIEWNSLNKMCVPVSIFSKEALNYLLNVDGRFIKVDSR